MCASWALPYLISMGCHCLWHILPPEGAHIAGLCSSRQSYQTTLHIDTGVPGSIIGTRCPQLSDPLFKVPSASLPNLSRSDHLAPSALQSHTRYCGACSDWTHKLDLESQTRSCRILWKGLAASSSVLMRTRVGRL